MITSIPQITKTLFIGLVLLSWFSFSDPERETRVRVEPQSEVVIAGTTNVNNFTCKYNLQELEVPIRLIYDEKSEHILFKNAELKLVNDCFDCGGRKRASL